MPINPLLVVGALILLGLNLRPVLAAVGPLLDPIQQATGLSHIGASLLTTLPIMLMGLCALGARPLRRCFGEQRGIHLGILLIALACGLRWLWPSAVGLLTTALLAGAGIAFVQALLPTFIKRHFMADSSRLMGFYSCAIMGGAAFAAASTPWLAEHASWPAALGVWAIPPLLAAWLWSRLGHTTDNTDNPPAAKPIRLYASPRAWALMLFFGIGTCAYTLVLTWLPPYYTALGWSPTSSGMLLAGLTLCEVTSGLLFSSLLPRWPDRRVPLFMVLGCLFFGLLCLVLAPERLVLLIGVLLGIGIGALFPLSLIVALEHLDDPQQAGDLLAFVQGGGYLIAAFSPLLAGLLRERFDDLVPSWLAMLGGCLLLMAIASRFAPGSGHFRR